MTSEEAYWAGLGPEDFRDDPSKDDEPEWTRADEEAAFANADYYDEVAAAQADQGEK